MKIKQAWQVARRISALGHLKMYPMFRLSDPLVHLFSEFGGFGGNEARVEILPAEWTVGGIGHAVTLP
jgi:hypothetical protein